MIEKLRSRRSHSFYPYALLPESYRPWFARRITISFIDLRIKIQKSLREAVLIPAHQGKMIY